jgi:hypothetical protein
MNQKELQKLIDKNINVGDQQFAVISGHFLTWYAMVDLGLLMILSALSDANDLRAFEALCAGLDAKAKVERIRKMAKLKGGIGPNFSAQLEHFYSKITRARNRLVHNAGRLNSKNRSRIQYISLELLEQAQAEVSNLDQLAHHSTVHELFAHAAWLRLFTGDVSKARVFLDINGVLEVDQPLAEMPKADRQNRQ